MITVGQIPASYCSANVQGILGERATNNLAIASPMATLRSSFPIQN